MAKLAEKISGFNDEERPQKRSAAEVEAANVSAKAQSISATAVLIEQYLWFVQAGVEIQPMMKKLMDDA